MGVDNFEPQPYGETAGQIDLTGLILSRPRHGVHPDPPSSRSCVEPGLKPDIGIDEGIQIWIIPCKLYLNQNNWLVVTGT